MLFSAHFLVALPASKSYEHGVLASSRGRSPQSSEVRFIFGAPRGYIIYVIRARPRQKAAGLLMVPAAGHADSPDHEWPARGEARRNNNGPQGVLAV